jgi:hypothetical protein
VKKVKKMFVSKKKKILTTSVYDEKSIDRLKETIEAQLAES